MGAGGGCLDIFTLVYQFSVLSPSLWETARYRLKNCLKGPLSPKQPTNRRGTPIIANKTVLHSKTAGGGRVVRWCWVSVLLIWIRVGQGPTTLEVGAGGGCLDIFSLVYHFSFLSPSLWERARYRLKYCLKGPLSPKQPTNQPTQKLPQGICRPSILT